MLHIHIRDLLKEILAIHNKSGGIKLTQSIVEETIWTLPYGWRTKSIICFQFNFLGTIPPFFFKKKEKKGDSTQKIKRKPKLLMGSFKGTIPIVLQPPIVNLSISMSRAYFLLMITLWIWGLQKFFYYSYHNYLYI